MVREIILWFVTGKKLFARGQLKKQTGKILRTNVDTIDVILLSWIEGNIAIPVDEQDAYRVISWNDNHLIHDSYLRTVRYFLKWKKDPEKYIIFF